MQRVFIYSTVNRRWNYKILSDDDVGKDKIYYLDECSTSQLREIFNRDMKIGDIQLYNYLTKNKEYIQCRRISIAPKDKNDFCPYTGCPYKPIQDDSKIQLYLKHIKTVICDGNAIYYDYIIKWLAYIMQNPLGMTQVALVIISKQGGTGKNLFANVM